MARSASPLLETLGVFVLVFAVQSVVELAGGIGLTGSLFVLSAPLEVDPWTVVTSVYAHAGVEHLASNAVALVLFGWPVARATTRFRFHTFFLATGALAGIAHVLAGAYLPLGVAGGGVVGSSGAVFALMGYLLAGNRLSDGLAARLEVPRWAAVVVFVALAAAITVATGSSEVALVAHFTGFLVGLFAGRIGLLGR